MFSQNIFLAPILAAFLVFFLIPVIRKLSIKLGAVDLPNHRKKHKNAVPSSGGIAIFLGFLIAIFILTDLNPQTIGLLAGATAITLFGFLDDIFELPPFTKLIGQVIGAIIAIYFGVRIDFISDLLSNGIFNLGFLAVPITVVWIVGITNVINLLDGLDGLAAGVSGIASLTLGIISITMGQLEVAILAFSLAGASFAFLPYNFSARNKIFMGDAGSNFLGFSLATISVYGNAKVATIFTIIAPFIVLFIPIFDTLIVIIKRIKNHKPIAVGDREHFHHKLVDIIGLTQKEAVIFIYILTIIFGGLSLISAGFSSRASLIVLGACIVFLPIIAIVLIIWHQTKKNGKHNK